MPSFEQFMGGRKTAAGSTPSFEAFMGARKGTSAQPAAVTTQPQSQLKNDEDGKIQPAAAPDTPQNSPQTPPPLPAASAPVDQDGQKHLVPADSIATGVERIGGPHDIQLLPEGRAQAEAIAAIPGTFDRVLSSYSDRSQDSVHPSAEKAGVVVNPYADLDTIRHGEMEGLPASESKQQVAYYYAHPDERPPGVSKFTGLPAETVHEFMDRQIPVFEQALRYEKKNPDHAQLIAVSSTNQRALRAWVAAGAKSNHSFDPAVMIEPREDPGTMYSLSEDKTGNISMERINPSTVEKIVPTIYIISHFWTGWNDKPQESIA